MSPYLVSKQKHLKKISQLLSRPYLNLKSFHQFLQKNYLRSNKKERYQLKDHLFFFLFKKEFIKHFKGIGLVESIIEDVDNIERLVLLGAGPTEFLQRISALLKINKPYKTLYILTGHNAFSNTEIKILKKTEGITASNELEMIEKICAKYSLDANIVYTKELGSKSRANTKDTAYEYYKKNQSLQETLILSNQPYGLYQKAIFENIFDEKATLFAPKNKNKIKVSAYLDTLARLIYETI